MATGPILPTGIDARTGSYLGGALDPERIGSGLPESAAPSGEWGLSDRWEVLSVDSFGALPRLEPSDLSAAGWGVVFAENTDPAVYKALGPLLDHRRAEAGRRRRGRYREFTGPDGVRAGEGKQQFLHRHGVGPGPCDPDRLPYYLLLVGGPEAIPFAFQQQLDVQYAVGRIAFSDPESYHRYARAVVRAETGRRARRAAVCFGPSQPGDPVAERAGEGLARELARGARKELPEWDAVAVAGPAARRERFVRFLADSSPPGILFAAGHCAAPLPGSSVEAGALVCGDWPGPGRPVSAEECITADAVAERADLRGTVAVLLGSCSIGLAPLGTDWPGELARELGRAPAGLNRLPQRLLEAGALGVVGCVGPFIGPTPAGDRTAAPDVGLGQCLHRLAKGAPVGWALQAIGEQGARAALDLSVEVEARRYGKTADPGRMVHLWAARNDARQLVLLGDPAARLPR
jgi:hypothetical protein